MTLDILIRNLKRNVITKFYKLVRKLMVLKFFFPFQERCVSVRIHSCKINEQLWKLSVLERDHIFIVSMWNSWIPIKIMGS